MASNDRRGNRRTQALLIPWIVLASAITSFAQEIKPGDKVTAIKWDAEFRSGAQIVGKSSLGDNYVVDKVDGDWLWIESRKGYLQRADVIAYDHAIEHFTAAIEREPQSSAAYHDRATAWRRRGEYKIAIGDYSEAIRLDPLDPAPSYSGRGLAWHSEGDIDNAIADYDEAIRVDPQSPDVYLNRGVAWGIKGEVEKEIADFSEAIRLNPKYSLAFNNRGLVWERKGDIDKAIADYSEAIRLDPHSVDAYKNRAEVWDAKGESDKAISDLTEVIRLDRNVEHFCGRATLYARQCDYDHALSDLTEALSIDPNSWFAHHRLCHLHLKRKNWPEVVKVATRCLELDDATISNCYRGRAYQNLGRFEEALSDLIIYQDGDRNDNALVEIAVVHAAMGKYEEASREFTRIAELPESLIFLKSPCVMFLSGCPEARFRDGKLALRIALSMKDSKRSVDLIEAKAAAYAECGDFKEAVFFQKEAIESAERQKLHETYIASLKERLVLFEAGKPFRLPTIHSSNATVTP